MTRVECEFEAEVLQAVVQSRWPSRATADLRAHVAECSICSDVLAVAAAFDEAREDTRAAVDVPAAGHVWRVAQLRARREAAAKATAPITVAQMVGFGCAFGVAGACFGATSTWFQSLVGSAVSALSGENARALLALAAQHGFLVAGVVMLMIVVPAAVWLTAAGD